MKQLFIVLIKKRFDDYAYRSVEMTNDKNPGFTLTRVFNCYNKKGLMITIIDLWNGLMIRIQVLFNLNFY